MKKHILLSILICFVWNVQAQDLVPIPTKTKSVYNDFIMDFGVQFTDKQLSTEDESEVAVRTIAFTNFTNFTHFNFNNNFGVITGLGLRNIGIRARNEHIEDVVYKRTIRRIYTVNASLAVKLGAFSKHCFVFGGGEYDLAFHFRQRLKTKNNSQTKQGEWFSNATDLFLPSVFIGVQFPKGLNLKCSYYFNDFWGTVFDIAICSCTTSICSSGRIAYAKRFRSYERESSCRGNTMDRELEYVD